MYNHIRLAELQMLNESFSFRFLLESVIRLQLQRIFKYQVNNVIFFA
jgi:hypothetical protein